MEQLTIEKTVWTEADFDIMGWHDATIYGLSFEIQPNDISWDLLLDIDYIFKWVKDEDSHSFKFWVAPCTLIFKESLRIEMDIKTTQYVLQGLEIADIHLIEKNLTGEVISYNWCIDLHDLGHIKLQSQGFEQVVRQAPILLDVQGLTVQQRGGTSFDRISNK